MRISSPGRQSIDQSTMLRPVVVLLVRVTSAGSAPVRWAMRFRQSFSKSVICALIFGSAGASFCRSSAAFTAFITRRGEGPYPPDWK